jgi:hypothetical protein
MAVTKIKAIKSTLDKAIDYICNPEKTDGGLLIDSYNCVPEFAALQMTATGKKNKRGGCRKAYHLMQSFSPEDDITPEQALEIGKAFANKVTRGKHEYVIAVHNDHDHIHCHIIFNAINFKDYGKYRYQGYSERDRIRDISDKLCRDNGLSVLPRTEGKGKKYNKYKESKETWMEKIRTAIDSAILTSETFDDFIATMEMEGFTFKPGKLIAFIADEDGQQRVTRCKTIGSYYSEEMIRDRIANKEKYKDIDFGEVTKEERNVKSGKRKSAGRSRKNDSVTTPNEKGSINLIKDVSKNIKAQNSPGYKYVVDKNNLNELVRTMNFLTENDIDTPDKFKKFYDRCHDEVIGINREIQKKDLEISDLHEKKNYIRKYFANKKYYYTFMKYKNMRYYNAHEDEIKEFEIAKKWLESNEVDIKNYTREEFDKTRDDLQYEKNELYEKLKSSKSVLRDAGNVMKNIENVLGIKLYEKPVSKNGDEHGNTQQDNTQDKQNHER